RNPFARPATACHDSRMPEPSAPAPSGRTSGPSNSSNSSNSSSSSNSANSADSSGSFASTASRDRFEALVAEADAVSVDGWDFSWLDGRATEERPSGGYARAMAERLGRAHAALDLQTGGGEVLAAAPKLPPVTVATEAWPPNVARATALLHP